MIKRRGLLLIMVSLLLALGAAWVARGWIQARLLADSKSAGISAPVVVAAMEIPFGTKVEARHLMTVNLPSSAPLGAHYEKPADVVGLIATQKVVAGEILLKERFAERTAGSTLAALVRPDKRAVSVRVDDVVGVGGFLLPGNHVDVVASRLDNNRRAEARTVLEDLTVLAVDQTASNEKDQPVVVRAVTLEVSPPQAEILVKACEEGKIQLTLRNPLQTAAPIPEAVARTETLKGAVRKSHASPVRPPDNGITIIRGTNVHGAESAT
jgi:pilus assembly protein CpaB